MVKKTRVNKVSNIFTTRDNVTPIWLIRSMINNYRSNYPIIVSIYWGIYGWKWTNLRVGQHKLTSVGRMPRKESSGCRWYENRVLIPRRERELAIRNALQTRRKRVGVRRCLEFKVQKSRRKERGTWKFIGISSRFELRCFSRNKLGQVGIRRGRALLIVVHVQILTTLSWVTFCSCALRASGFCGFRGSAAFSLAASVFAALFIFLCKGSTCIHYIYVYHLSSMDNHWWIISRT